MKEKIIKFYMRSDKFFSLPFSFSIFITIAVTILFLLFYNRFPPRVPLFYSLPWGEAQLVVKQQLFLLPIILLLITLTNFFIAFQLHSIQYILKRILYISLFLISTIIFITAVKILMIFT